MFCKIVSERGNNFPTIFNVGAPKTVSLWVRLASVLLRILSQFFRWWLFGVTCPYNMQSYFCVKKQKYCLRFLIRIWYWTFHWFFVQFRYWIRFCAIFPSQLMCILVFSRSNIIIWLPRFQWSDFNSSSCLLLVLQYSLQQDLMCPVEYEVAFRFQNMVFLAFFSIFSFSNSFQTRR